MKKAIFLDYTGTMVQEDEPNTRALLKYFISHSELKDPNEILKIVWGKIKQLEFELKGDKFKPNVQRINIILDYCVKNCGLEADLKLMHEMWQKIWVHAPLFDDVKPFFETAKLPIYVLSNDDLIYLEQSFDEKGLHPDGVISAEMSRACKPHSEIFEKALEIAGVEPSEAIHIGDSIVSDAEPAKKLGIEPILIDRTGKINNSEIRVVKSLNEMTI